MFAVSRKQGADALDKVDPDMWMHLAWHLNCGEANAVAAFLRGYGSDPTEFLMLHAEKDDEDDIHRRLNILGWDIGQEVDRAVRSAVGSE